MNIFGMCQKHNWMKNQLCLIIHKVINDNIYIILEHDCCNICHVMKLYINYKNAVMIFNQRSVSLLEYILK